MKPFALIAIAALMVILILARRRNALEDYNRPRCFGEQYCEAGREEISCINCEYAFECLKETRERWARK